MLSAIAARLLATTNGAGFAARLGGDEFTVVYRRRQAAWTAVHSLGQDLVRAFQAPIDVDGRDLMVSISVGASMYPDHGSDAEALLRAADAALFRAKALGRSQLVVFNPELLEAASAKFTIEQGLRYALERREFELVFQPEVDAATLNTRLVEALLRWRLPDGRWRPAWRVSGRRRRVGAHLGNQRLGAAHLHRNGGALASWRVAGSARRHQPLLAPAARCPLCRPRDRTARASIGCPRAASRLS